MRELKLRYRWNGSWYYIDLRRDNNRAKFEAFESVNKTTHLEQLIEYDDMLGRELYEGDVIEFDEFARLNPRRGLRMEVKIPDIYLMRSGMVNIKVIGNVHEHPEEKEKKNG